MSTHGAPSLKIEKRVEIEYRRATHSWRAVGYTAYASTANVICGYGSLRRARRKAREWLREHDEPVLFETMRP